MAPRRQTSEGPGDSTARILAVFALAITAIIVLVVVVGSLGGDSGSSSQPAQPSGTRPATTPKPATKYYVIQQNDTFDGIAAKVGVPSSELQRLNPELDTQQLPLSGCVNVVPDGCKAQAQGG